MTRTIMTRTINKCKARLIENSLQYNETYAPGAKWNSIRILLTLALMNNWKTQQLDYIMAYPQAPVEKELYMELPKGFDIEGCKREDYVLQIHRNIYGQKQAGRVWNKYLVDKLVNVLHFKQSKVDECVFYRG